MRKELFLPKARIADKKEKILTYCQDKVVLDIGMGGHIDDMAKSQQYFSQDLDETLHGQLSKVTRSLDGMDINPLAIEMASKKYKGQYFLGDLTDPNLAQQINKKYDVIVFGDVIEHLDMHRVALQNLKAMLNPGGIIIITTVNAYCFDSILKLLFSYECVHEEHTCYFSFITMRRLLSMSELKINDFGYYRHQGKKFDSLAHFIGVKVKNIITSFLPQYEMGLFFVVSA
jgi:2-polyprenyl-3-methyl-5-hydroxy-6-metoxy-1,4-benzoquinol methylase